MSGRFIKGTYLLSFGLFVAACAGPAVAARRGNPIGAVMEFSDRHDMVPHRGWLPLATGWIPVAMAVSDPADSRFEAGGLAWLANPLALAGAVLVRSRRPAAAAACGWLGVGLGVAFLVSPPQFNGRPVGPLVGAYLWVGSLAVFAAGASAAGLVGLRRSHTIPAEPGVAPDRRPPSPPRGI